MVKKQPGGGDAEEAGVSSKEGAVKGLLKSKGIYLIYLIRENIARIANAVQCHN